MRHLRRHAMRGGRRPRLVGLAITTILALAPASLGAAATDPCQPRTTSTADVSITVWQPSDQASAADAHQCTPPSGSTLTGSWNVRIDALSLTSLKTFTVSIQPADGSVPALPASAVSSRTYPGILLSRLSDTIQVTWDTGSLTPYNGTYQVSVTATSLIGRASALVSHLLINNPPATPPGPTAALDGTTPVLTWPANSEPDLTGYRVLRSDGGPAYSIAGTVSTNSFRDVTAPQAKPLTYEIQALRRSPTDANGVASAASAPSGAVTVTPPAVQSSAPPAPKVTARPVPQGPISAQQAAASTFAPTLPFNQALPQPAPPPTELVTVTTQALPGGRDVGTTLRQKAMFLAIAVLILVVSFSLIKFARKLARGDD